MRETSAYFAAYAPECVGEAVLKRRIYRKIENMKLKFCALSVLLAVPAVRGEAKTYCNPLNLDYAYNPFTSAAAPDKHRSTADPVITLYKGDYYLFSSNQQGYWWSPDMADWTFVPRSFTKVLNPNKDDVCAPAVMVYNGALFVVGKAEGQPLWSSTEPKAGVWSEFSSAYTPGDDPAFFVDDDGKVYRYSGSSNIYPIYGEELDRTTLEPVGARKPLLSLHGDIHGWERFGEHNDNTFLDPFVEGAWMNKRGGKYYLQYGAPGTEFSGYADGVYVGDSPLGPFAYQKHNPFSYKPGGFVRGAGHGATFQDKFGGWWHVATNSIGVKYNFERRISMWPAGFDKDGTLYADTAYGDYPHNLSDGSFTGWMLLNYGRPLRVSSTLGGHVPAYAADEDIKTYWSAATGSAGEWIESDLGSICDVRAVQLNYADQDAELLGKQAGISHKYRLYSSTDGSSWRLLADKSGSVTDTPHAYLEFPAPVEARFIKLENVSVPTGKFALSGLRVFGKGRGKKPEKVGSFVALRGAGERRNAWLRWRLSDDAVGYTIYAGSSPDKLYTSITVYGRNEYYFNAMDKDQPYYFRIEAFNENGIGERSELVEAP